MAFSTTRLATALTATAPDGSLVRVLCKTARGSMIQFSLPAGAVSRPIAHRTVDELWLCLSGRGRLWRRLADQEETVELEPGVSASLPVGTSFQFRSDGAAPLVMVAVTMPPWPGEDEAVAAEGYSETTV